MMKDEEDREKLTSAGFDTGERTWIADEWAEPHTRSRNGVTARILVIGTERNPGRNYHASATNGRRGGTEYEDHLPDVDAAIAAAGRMEQSIGERHGRR